MKKKDIDIVDFYKMNLLGDDILGLEKENHLREELNGLFIMRIFWKLMNDLDTGNGYNVEGWKSKDYCKFLNRLDEIDLNKDEYRLYFKEMVTLLISSMVWTSDPELVKMNGINTKIEKHESKGVNE